MYSLLQHLYGRVDHNDQLRGYYNIPIKSRKYYKYLFFAAMDVIVTNNYVCDIQIFPRKSKEKCGGFPDRFCNGNDRGL